MMPRFLSTWHIFIIRKRSAWENILTSERDDIMNGHIFWALAGLIELFKTSLSYISLFREEFDKK